MRGLRPFTISMFLQWNLLHNWRQLLYFMGADLILELVALNIRVHQGKTLRQELQQLSTLLAAFSFSAHFCWIFCCYN